MSPWLLLVLGLTAAGVICGLMYPFYSLMVYICFAILRPESLWFWAVPEWNYSRVVAQALIVGWLMACFAQWKEKHPDIPIPSLLVSFVLQPVVFLGALFSGRRTFELGREQYIVAALMLFFMLSTAGAILSPDRTKGLEFVESMSKIIIPFLVGMTFLNTIQRLKQLAWLMLLTQGYVCLELNIAYLGGYNRLQIDGFGGMDNNCVAIGLVTSLGMGFIMTMESPKTWQKVLAGFATGLIGHAVLISLSRGGMLGTIVTGIVAFVLMKKTPVHYLLIGVVILMTLYTTGDVVRQRFLSAFGGKKDDFDESAQDRLTLWKACIVVISENPVLGVGPNQWGDVVTRFGYNQGKEAHTLWLQLGAELGLPTLGCLIAFFLLSILQALPFAREKIPLPDPWLNSAARMVIAALIGFCFSAQFVSIKTLEIPYYVALLGAGVLKMVSIMETQALERWAAEHAAAMGTTALVPVGAYATEDLSYDFRTDTTNHNNP